ncbi:glycosyltransferase [Paenibacillus sp. FSL E2-0201]|uniref:glycosyltransferase n=1 Tax=Paenibacillus sp. FSL E2-0201 TaxID=2954726 RepID=UPI0030DA2494
MKVMFAHDSIFINNNENIFTTGSLNYNVWQRYLKVFDEIVIASRMRYSNESEGLDISSGENVSFCEVPNLSSPVSKIVSRKKAVDILTRQLLTCDALIVRLPSEIGNLAVRLAVKHKIPWAVEVVGCAWDSLWNYGNLKGKIYAPIAKKNMEKIVSKSMFSLYVTNHTLQRKYPSYGRQVSCSNVEIPYVENEILEKKMKNIYNLEKKIIIGLIGSLKNNIKGIDTAIKSLSLINCSIELRVLGGGDTEKWRKLAEDEGVNDLVYFDGKLQSGAAVYEWLDNIDLYIQPSYQEGLPRALIEAMSRGCPSIGSTAGGIPELLEIGCLHAPGDYITLAKNISKLLSDKNMMKKQSERNFSIARDYARINLDKRRTLFWKDFYESFNETKVGNTQI